MKTRHLWTVLSTRVITDDKTRLVSLLDVVERVNVEINSKEAPKEIIESLKKEEFSEPFAVNHPVTLVSQWRIDEKERGEKYDVETKIIGPNCREFKNPKFEIETNKDMPNHRLLINIPNIPVVGSGEYIIETILSKKDKEIGKSEYSLLIDVKVI